MKLKRLIAITVALATLLSCSCIAGSVVSAADGDTVISYWDGMLTVDGDSKIQATPGVLYGRTTDGYTIDGVVSTDNTLYVSGLKGTKKTFSLASASRGTGTLSTLEYPAGSDRTGYYYDISYATLRLNDSTTFSLAEGGTRSLADGVFSMKFDINVPEEYKTGDRYFFTKSTTDTAGSNAAAFYFDYAYDSTTGKGSLSTRPWKAANYTVSWSDSVEIEYDKWYTCELRYTMEGNNLVVAGYIDGKQISYNTFNLKGETDTALTLGQQDFICSSTADAQVHTYFDEISYTWLSDKEAFAPVATEPYENEYLWGHFDIDGATVDNDAGTMSIPTTADSVNSAEELVISTVNDYTGATYALEDDAAYGSKVLKQSVVVDDETTIGYHRLANTYRNFFTKHNGLEQEVVTEYAFDVKVPSEDINYRREFEFSYPGGDSLNRSDKTSSVIIANGEISGADSAGADGYFADVADAEVSKPVEFTPDVWHKVRILNYYTYDAASKSYDVTLNIVCDNYIVFENKFVITHAEGYEENFGLAMIEYMTYASADTTVETYFGDITIKSFANSTYDDSAFDWWVDPNRIEYSAVREGNKVTVTADIYGNEDLAAGDACMVIALYDASGRVSKLVPVDVSIAAYDGNARQLTAELEDANVVAGTKIKAFVFDTLTSAIPLIENYSDTLE